MMMHEDEDEDEDGTFVPWTSAGTISPVYRSPSGYNGMSIATELGMAPANSGSVSGSLTGTHHACDRCAFLHVWVAL